MGSSQHEDTILAPLDIRSRNIVYGKKGPTIRKISLDPVPLALIPSARVDDQERSGACPFGYGEQVGSCPIWDLGLGFRV